MDLNYTWIIVLCLVKVEILWEVERMFFFELILNIISLVHAFKRKNDE